MKHCIVKVLRMDGARYSDGYFLYDLRGIDHWREVGNLIHFYDKNYQIKLTVSAYTLLSIQEIDE